MGQRDVKSQRDLIHVGNVTRCDVFAGYLVAAVGAEDGHPLLIMRAAAAPQLSSRNLF